MTDIDKILEKRRKWVNIIDCIAIAIILAVTTITLIILEKIL